MTFRLLKVGSDAEFFLRGKLTGEPVPCIGLFGGTKKDPIPVLDKPGFAIQEDNVMAEINIPAANNIADFYKDGERMLNWLREEADKKGCEVIISPSMHFRPEQLDHPQAKAIGCEPDYCVWTRTVNEFDENKRHLLQTLRSAGGHVHISFENSNKEPITEEDRELLVMFCDLFLGIPSVLSDLDIDRKKLYGKAGSFRFKDYGIEYRVLSNFWYKTTYHLAWVFQSVERAVESMNHKSMIRSLFDQAKRIQTTIDTQDNYEANSIIQEWGLRLPG